MESHHHRGRVINPTISEEYLLEFTSEYGIPEDLHPELPGPEDTIIDFPEGKVGAPKDGMPPADSYSALDCPESCQGYRTLPRAAYKVPLLTAMANRVIDMEDTTGASRSSGTPSTVEKSPLDFADEDLPFANLLRESGKKKKEEQTDTGYVRVSLEFPIRESFDHKVGSRVVIWSRRWHVAIGCPLQQKASQEREIPSNNGKAASSTITPAAQDTPTDAKCSVNRLDSLSSAEPRPIPEQDIAQSSKKTIVAEDPDSERCVPDVVDHIAQPWFFLELRQLPNDEFLNQYNINLVWQVAMGSQLRLRFKQKVKLLKKSVAQVARRDQKIEAKEKQIKNLEALLEAEADMKKAEEAKNAELMKELEGLRSQFTYLQLSNQQMSQKVSTLQAQITGEEKIKAALEEFKKYEVAGRGLRGCWKRNDPEAHNKYLKALQELKDLKYPLVDQLEGLKDAPMELIMTSLHLESDSGEDAPQWIRDLRPTEEERRSDGWFAIQVTPRAPFAILLADASTQTEISKGEASLRLFRSMFLPAMYNLDWP
ncbi:hypothetical protein Tco_0278531 [Tanacetum coccineum]